jgi:CarD family transcriptional regulator
MFKKGEKVIYPMYGAGEIKNIPEQELNGETQEYYKVVLENSDVSVLIPTKNAEKIGMRKPMTKKDMKKLLDTLGKSIIFNKEKEKEVKKLSTKQINTTDLKEIISIMNLIIAYEKERKKSDKTLGVTHTQILERGAKFLKSEIEIVLGKKAINNYQIIQAALQV